MIRGRLVLSLLLLFGFFAVGLVMTLFVRETAGLRAARRAERETALSRATDPTDRV